MSATSAGEAAAPRPGAHLPRLDVHDVVAGLSVAVILIPQSLAYAQLAGVPAYRGLYAAAIPPLVAAPFASSPYLQPGPTAITALLTYGALNPLAQVGSPRYIELGLLLACLVGAIRIAVGLVGAGGIAYLMSQPLLVGFVPAAAILIVGTQIPVVLGMPPHGSHELYRAAWVISHPHGWHPETLVVALVAAALLGIAAWLFPPRFPIVLVVVLGMILYSKYGRYDGKTLGHIHTGLPPLTESLPLHVLPRLIVPAAVIALLGFIEASSIARTYATLDRKRWDANREFISQGLANVAAGTFGGIPVGASFSRSALNRIAGARTSASGFVTGLTVLAFLYLGFLLAPLPNAVLAAVVIVAVTPLVRLDRIFEIAQMSRIQASISVTAFVLTLILAPRVEWAILSSIGLSIAIHLWRELRLDLADASHGQELELTPQGVLWFGNTRKFEDRFVHLLATHTEARVLVMNLEGLGRIDLTGALTLQTLIADARAAGLDVEVRRAPQHAQRVLGRVLPLHQLEIAGPEAREANDTSRTA